MAWREVDDSYARILSFFIDVDDQGFAVETAAVLNSKHQYLFPVRMLQISGVGKMTRVTQLTRRTVTGLFEQAETLQACLAWTGLSSAMAFDHNERREQELERLADAIEVSMNMDHVIALLQANSTALSERERG